MLNDFRTVVEPVKSM